MVTLINHFTVKGDTAEFEQVFAASSEFMVEQPGFVSHRLVRSLRAPGSYVNIAEWESAAAHQAVVRGPGFAEHIKGLADLASVEPDLYTEVLGRVADGA